MEGRQYNRAVCIHKYVYEALMRIAWKGFPDWLEEHHPNQIDQVEEAMKMIAEVHDNLTQTACEETLARPLFISTASLLDNYLPYLRHENGPLLAYWMSYIDVVGDILLGLLRASREGDWELHMAAIRKMIPWCFAYDETNYASLLW